MQNTGRKSYQCTQQVPFSNKNSIWLHRNSLLFILYIRNVSYHKAHLRRPGTQAHACHPAIQEVWTGGSQSRPVLAKMGGPIWKITKARRTVGMAKTVESLGTIRTRIQTPIPPTVLKIQRRHGTKTQSSHYRANSETIIHN